MQQLEKNTQERIDQWLAGPYDQGTKEEIRQLVKNGDWETLSDSFYKDLEFGTGGLRGMMGPGSNRVNRYTIGMVTQGFSNYLKKAYPNQEIGVAIAHDSRNNHQLYADTCADVFSSNGIKVYYFTGLRPTPELSFAVRQLKCKGGVMLTASHNPREYNGYKAYGADGGQLISPVDQEVITEVRAIQNIDQVKFEGNKDLIQRIGEDIDKLYLDQLKALSLHPEVINRQKDLKIVFSAIHGAGGVLVPTILKRYGFENILEVEEQSSYDGNFPTVIYPNPEEEEAMSMALKKAEEVGADIIMATDPDADRVGMGIKDQNGNYVLLNGNQTGCLLINYVLSSYKELGKLEDRHYIVKTIVSSYLMDKIAEARGVDCFNTLTGFKHIGALMTKLEGERSFVVGGEESYGYLIGEVVRDKDAVISAAMIAEMTAYYKDQGQSLFDALVEMYLEFGFYKEKLVYLVKKGKSGAEEIANMMDNFRTNPPTHLGDAEIVEIRDYLKSKGQKKSGESYTINLPKSNVLQFVTADRSIVSARPSGTEPKIKFYCSVNHALETKEDYEKISQVLDDKLELMINDLMNR